MLSFTNGSQHVYKKFDSVSSAHADATKRNGSSVDSVTERQQSSELPGKTRFFDIKGNMLDLLRIKGYYIS